jgi:poly(3-hydroxybutyrate) depolymerase
MIANHYRRCPLFLTIGLCALLAVASSLALHAVPNALSAPLSEAIPLGRAKLEIMVSGTRLEVFTYKPAKYANGPLLLVFHGMLRNADVYRDHAIAMADRFGAMVAAPRFDMERFPDDRYQLGGLLTTKKTIAPKAEWTWSLIPALAAELRTREGNPKLPYYLLGHSAGGQFLARMAAFADTGAERLVVANPGTHLFPVRTAAYPYGFGGLPDELSDDSAHRRYVAQPLTFYLGTKDVVQDDNFPRGKEEDRQGDSRFVRGKNAFAAGKELAASKGWYFNWRLVEADGVGHDHEKMFDHPACKDALFGSRTPKESLKK